MHMDLTDRVNVHHMFHWQVNYWKLPSAVLHVSWNELVLLREQKAVQDATHFPASLVCRLSLQQISLQWRLISYESFSMKIPPVF